MEVDYQLEDPQAALEEGERLGRVKDMRLEAEAVVSDVLFAVTHMSVSHALSSSLDVAFINVETREGDRYCLELSEAGLRVVGHTFDQVEESQCCPAHLTVYESVYALLDSLSPGYRHAFATALLHRLETLQQSTQ
ncbi:GSK3-beta interaction protein isoform X2 [Sardina pilchardus]